MSDAFRILAVLGLVGANAFFVVGEYSIVTARRARLTTRAATGGAGAQSALRLMDDPVRVISTAQVGITAVGILTGALGEPTVHRMLGDGMPRWASFALAFGLVAYVSVVLGELLPKALTLQRAEAMAALVSRPMELLSRVLTPVIVVLEASARVLLRPFGINEIIVGNGVRTAGELRALVGDAQDAGVIPRAQEELLHNIFDFADREAGDIMVAALDVAWLDATWSIEAAIEIVLSAPHTRYPVGRGNLDGLVGTVHVRDLIRATRGIVIAGTVSELARPPLVVPETKDLGALLRLLRDQKEHLAIVVSEYGAVAGIVTLEDILEEIVGDIEDEFDLPDATVAWLDDRTVEVAGSITIDDFNEAVGTTLPQGGPRTIAGLIFDAIGHQPTVGEKMAVDDVELLVAAVDGLRITRVRATLPAAVAA